jgi:hypothetical protein
MTREYPNIPANSPFNRTGREGGRIMIRVCRAVLPGVLLLFVVTGTTNVAHAWGAAAEQGWGAPGVCARQSAAVTCPHDSQ